MEKQKDKRKLFKRIGAIVCAFAAAIVAFSLPFLGNFKPKFNSKNMVASADEVVATEFSGSWLYCPVGSLSNINKASRPYVGIMRMSFTSSSFTLFMNSPALPSEYSVSYPYTITSGFVTVSRSASHHAYEYAVNGLFDFINISYCEYGSYFYEGSLYTKLRYIDKNGNSIDFNVICERSSVDTIPSTLEIAIRQYIIGATFSSDQAYNAGYSMGYNDGNSAGYSAGEAAGYSSGYSAGETIGYNNGYSQGVEAGGNYTFFSLVSAVIDAPIQAFMGLFNFELLGINLAGFFTGLLTLAFIITIVRLVMP